MEPETTQTLKIGSIFFIFTHQCLFLVPEHEYERIQQTEEGYVCLERKYLPETATRDTERVTCIVCHGEAAPEDFVFPLCREMHFVVCEECMEGIQERTDERKVFCPYCKEKRSDNKTFQEEILGVILSLMPHQTLPSLEIRPGMEVKTIMRLPRGNKVSLSNFFVSDAFFSKLLSKTAVEITNGVSLFAHANSLDCCLGEFDARTRKQASIRIGEHTNQEMKQIYENIKTIPKNNIQAIAKEIHAVENGICVLLKLLDGADGYIPDLLLESPKEECIKEILGTESNLSWVGRAKKLRLVGHAVGILPKL
ncbi:MAG: uncharacterized protein A8A55_3137, partial [Amphiamblys sp. WSBS2006]